MEELWTKPLATLVIVIIMSLGWWLVDTWNTHRVGIRRDRVKRAAEKLRDEMVATSAAYRDQGKRVPHALAELLSNSWDTYLGLRERYWWVRNEAEVVDITTKADEAVAAIQAQVVHVPTDEELDADEAALKAAMVSAVQENVKAIAETERKHAAAVAAVDRTRDEELYGHKRRLEIKQEDIELQLKQIAAAKKSPQLENMREAIERQLELIAAEKSSRQ